MMRKTERGYAKPQGRSGLVQVGVVHLQTEVCRKRNRPRYVH